jgi:site-specific recombinase XerD
MMARNRRKRIGRGIYRDRYGLAAVVKVGTGGGARQREHRFPFDTPHADIKDWQETARAELRQASGCPVTARGTFAADAEAYLKQTKQLISYKSRACEVAAWTALYGRLRRVQITAEHVRLARARWAGEDYAPKTINNRCQTLRHLYRVLDGKRAPTPVDDVDRLNVPDSPKVLVPAIVFRTVAANLTDQRTRARFMVLASSGARPSELRRAEPSDVDLERRVWTVRTGKGGDIRAMFLNDDMLTAWKAFIATEAWGTFDGSDYAKKLYAAGWPEDVRPYQARHSVALELGERGADIGDVQGWLGHRQITTTRRHYAPVLTSRLKHASDTLAGRFSGWAAPEPTLPAEAQTTTETVH